MRLRGSSSCKEKKKKKKKPPKTKKNSGELYNKNSGSGSNSTISLKTEMGKEECFFKNLLPFFFSLKTITLGQEVEETIKTECLSACNWRRKVFPKILGRRGAPPKKNGGDFYQCRKNL